MPLPQHEHAGVVKHREQRSQQRVSHPLSRQHGATCKDMTGDRKNGSGQRRRAPSANMPAGDEANAASARARANTADKAPRGQGEDGCAAGLARRDATRAGPGREWAGSIPPQRTPVRGFLTRNLTWEWAETKVWCLLSASIRQGLRGGSGPHRLIRALGIEPGNPIITYEQRSSFLPSIERAPHHTSPRIPEGR